MNKHWQNIEHHWIHIQGKYAHLPAVVSMYHTSGYMATSQIISSVAIEIITSIWLFLFRKKSSLILLKSSSICFGHSNLSLVASFVGWPFAHANNPLSSCFMKKWFVLLLLFSIGINQTNIFCNMIVICMICYKFATVVTYHFNLAIVCTASLL